MPTYEHCGLFSYKDENKNSHLLYPVTKKGCVEGLEKDLSTKQNALTGQPGQVVGFGTDGRAQAVPGWSNPNLLDNAYWANKDVIINQKGQLEYTASGYTIDRWKLDTNGGEAKVQILDGFIRGQKIKKSASGGSSHAIYTSLESPKGLSGQTVTLSVLRRGPGHFQMILLSGSTILAIKSYPSSENWTLNELTANLPDSMSSLAVFIYFDASASETGYSDIKAAKLELGLQQTLAHQNADGSWVLNDPPPNKALEMAKCQRYQFVVRHIDSYATVGNGIVRSDGTFDLVIPTPTTMRSIPAVSIIGSIVIDFIFGTKEVTSVTPYNGGAGCVNFHGTLGEPIAASGPCWAYCNPSSQVILDCNL